MESEGKLDYSLYVQRWRERLAQQEKEQKVRAERLREVARACARHLVQNFRAKRVYLFGSLLADDLVQERSDIDLAVEGLDKSLYFRALADLYSLLPPGVELDLVPLESARPDLAEQITSEGILLDGCP